MSESRYRHRPCISRRVSVRLVIIHDPIAEDSIDGVPAVGLCGTASGVGIVADDGDAGCASWEDCGDCAARNVG